MQPLVDGCRQVEHFHQLMDQADAAVRRTDGPFRYLKMNVGSPEHGLRQVIGKVGLVEALDDSLLACANCDPS